MSAVHYSVTIRNNDSGERVEYAESVEHIVDDIFDDDYLAVARWERGNWSCDCNRELFFESAKGNNPQFDSVSCGQGRYSVQVRTSNGNVLYDELNHATVSG